MKIIIYPYLIAILLLISCASLPPQNPIDENSSIIGIYIEIKDMTFVEGRIFQPEPCEIYFIKLNETEDSYLSDNNIIKSNYYKNGQYYLLNAKPGRYIAIAAFQKLVINNWDSKGNIKDTSINNYTFYFPIDLIQLTDNNLQLGQIVFMGKYIIYSPFGSWYGIKNPDKAQLYYGKRFQPDKINMDKIEQFFEFLSYNSSEEYDFVVSVKLQKKDLSNKAEIEFWLNTINYFKGTTLEKMQYKKLVAKNKIWIDIINKHLNEIQTN